MDGNLKGKEEKADQAGKIRLDRRTFLRGMVTAGAGLLAACAGGDITGEPEAFRTATPARILESPQAPQDGTQEPVAEGSISLENFLAFSSLLTGVDNLDPNLGRVYLNALQSGGGDGPSLSDVYGAASSGSGPLPQNVGDLDSAGFFGQQEYSDVADQIISMWYTGVYKDGDQEVVATFVDALAWKVLHFTKPLTICGQFGFWSREPQVDLSPTFQYTPVPTQPGGSSGG